MEEKDKEFEESIREKIETICKQQFMLGLMTGHQAAWEIAVEQTKGMTSAKKIKKFLKDKLDVATTVAERRQQEVKHEE